MLSPMKVVIVGGVAAGPKVAYRIIRLKPDAKVTILEKGRFLSYAGCGLPYYVSGVVKEQAELMSTPVGVVRDAAFFQKVKNVRAMSQTEATEVDRIGERVRVRNVTGGDESWLPDSTLTRIIHKGREGPRDRATAGTHELGESHSAYGGRSLVRCKNRVFRCFEGSV